MDLHIPETVASPFVVATADPPHDPSAVARARVGHPLAAGLLDSPLVQIRIHPAGESGYADLMRNAAWVTPQERPLLDKTTHHIVVTGHVPPVSQPDHGQALRAITRAIAESCDGIVYDGWSHQIMSHDFRFGAEHPEFCLADGWLATFISGDEDAMIAKIEGLRLMTAGLHRFALPELEAVDVPLGNSFAAVTLLRCLSVALLSEHWDWLACNPGARVRRLTGHRWAEGRDVWRYWASAPSGPVGGRVRVRLRCRAEESEEELPYLTVGPPADFNAPPADWWNDVVDLAMPFIAKAPRRTAA
jgi:hypothetical protein